MVDLLDTSCWFDSMRLSLWNCSLYTSYHRLRYPFHVICVDDLTTSFWWSIWVLQGWIKASSQIIIGLNETKRTSQPRADTTSEYPYSKEFGTLWKAIVVVKSPSRPERVGRPLCGTPKSEFLFLIISLLCIIVKIKPN